MSFLSPEEDIVLTKLNLSLGNTDSSVYDLTRRIPSPLSKIILLQRFC